MTKIITKPSSFEEIKKTITKVDAYIIGIKDFSVNENLYVIIEELEEISLYLKEHNKELFVSLNKNMHNSDIEKIENILLKLNNYDVTGVMYYDVAFVNLKDRLNLNYDLVWASEHATTNYFTINYWESFGVKYTLVSSEITLDEILEIKKNTKSKLVVPIFGYLPMYVSKRHGVKNYLEYFNLKDDSSVNYLKKEDVIYPIIDNEVGTMIYSGYILNGIKEVLSLKENEVDYILLNSFGIEEDKFISVLEMFTSVNFDNVKLHDEEISKMFDNVNSGFLWTKTISKVKKDVK